MMQKVVTFSALLLWGCAVQAQSAHGRQCEVQLDEAAGRYARCRLEASAAYARTGNTYMREAAFKACARLFEWSFASALKRGGSTCAVTAKTAEFMAVLARSADKVAAAAAGSTLAVNCQSNHPQAGMVYCTPVSNAAFDLYNDLLAAASAYGVTENTQLQVIAYGGGGGNGTTSPGGTTGYGGDGGYANTITTISAIKQAMGTTTVQWLAAQGGSHDSSQFEGGTGGSSSLVWVGTSAPSTVNTLVIAAGGGGGTYGDCCTDKGHDGGHGGYVNGSGSKSNGNYANYQATQEGVTFWVGTGENGHGDGGNPGSPPGNPGGGGTPYHDNYNGSGLDGFGGNGGALQSGSVSGSVGRPGWSGGSVSGETLVGTTGVGGDQITYYTSGAGGGGYGGGGAGGGCDDCTGGGAGGGSFALANAISGTDAAPEFQGSYVVFLFVTN